MAVYAIGDLQGCLSPFETLLDRLAFRAGRDRLWLAGDLVNRGPDSLGVLRRIHALRADVTVVLGNHDLYFLARAAKLIAPKEKDTLEALLTAEDCAALADWLRHQPIFHHDPALGWSMVHAGLHPDWDLPAIQAHAEALHQALRGPRWRDFLAELWAGPAPVRWDDCRTEIERQRFRAAVFTRARLMRPDGIFHWPSRPPETDGYQPWHALYLPRHPAQRLVCGHWAAQGLVRAPRLLALDSGCVWGNALSAARLDSGQALAPLWQVECDATAGQHSPI